jgi:hypothetical protein
MPRRLVFAAACAAAAGAIAGCASYSQKAIAVREPLVRGDVGGAKSYLSEHKPGGDGLPYLMELGLVLRLADEFDSSNVTFESAEVLIEDLYTKSLSKEAISLAVNDEVQAYDGEPWERVLINYYRALNYVDLGAYESALVECRKINHKLKVYADSDDTPPTYRTDAFAEYMTALLYEAGGETNDAWVSLRLADEAYAHYTEAYGVPAPSFLAEDLLRLAEAQGFRDDLERLRERFPDAAPLAAEEAYSRGQIVVFYEEGFAPAKIQLDIMIPILKTEYETLDPSQLAQRLSSRARAPHEVHYAKTELDYLLRIAIPAFPPRVPDEIPGHAVVRAAGQECRSEVAEDIAAIARRGLEDEMGRILFRTALRAIGKYALTRAAEKEDEGLGTLVNLLGAITEKADTRTWITLPSTIQIARVVVEPGVHDVVVDCFGPHGQRIDSVKFEDVDVAAGEVRFLSHRTFSELP